MLDIIGQVLNSSYREPIPDGNTFELYETDPNAACKVARFRKKKGKVLVYKFDKIVNYIDNQGRAKTIESIFPFFNDRPGLKAMADFLFFYQKEENEFYPIICNLKSGNKGNSKSQFKAAETFIQFIIDNALRVTNETNKDFKIHFVRKVLFSSKPLYSFNKNDWNQHAKKDTPINFQCSAQSICTLDAICNT